MAESGILARPEGLTMNVVILDYEDDLNRLRGIGAEWMELAVQNNIFAIPLDMEHGLNTLRNLVLSQSGDVLALVNGENDIKGFMGLSYQQNHVGPGLQAHECFFYVARDSRRHGIPLMLAAEKLAKAKGCSHMIMNASRLAGDGDRSGALYNRRGYVEYDTAYVRAL